MRELGALFRIALRNLLRHRRRSSLSLVAIVGGVVALLLAGGFIEWVFRSLREATIKTQSGHIQIAKEGFAESGARDRARFVIAKSPEAIRIVAGLPEVKVLAPRLSITGLLSHGDSSSSFLGDAVSPELERDLSSEIVVRQGRNLDARDPPGIIVGEGLAERLGLRVGDSVALLATAPNGGISGVDAQVRGVFSSPYRAYDDVSLRTTLQLGRQLLRTEGVHRYLVLLHDTPDTDRVRDQIAPLLDSGLTATPWHAGADFYHKTVTLFSRQFVVAKLVVAAIVLLAITNTMVMAVFERTGEIGTALALGVPRRSLLVQFLLEGLLLGAVGVTVGILAGMLLASIISAVGMPMPPPPQMRHGVVAQIFVTPRDAAVTGLLIAAAVVLATFYPAVRASRLVIVDALRHAR